MSRKKSKSGSVEDPPAWVDGTRDRTTPYTEAELDLLVADTIEGIQDTPAWLELVDKVGVDEARRTVRTRLIMSDDNAQKQTRH